MLAIGDVTKPVFPRSAIKALQALPLVEEGAADRYGFGDEELALACASHSGEPAHVAGVERMLAAPVSIPPHCAVARIGRSRKRGSRAGANRRAVGAAQQLLRQARGLSVPRLCDGYRPQITGAPEHPVQRQVRAVLEDFTGAVLARGMLRHRRLLGSDLGGTAGKSRPRLCQIRHRPRSGAPTRGGRRAAARGLRQKPWYVAGTGRFCTEIMQLFGARVFVKTGAEGVYCGALPEQGLGIAIKCDDGAGRAAQAIMAAMIARFLPLEAAERAALAPFRKPVLRNWNGFEVGAVRVTDVI